MGDLSVGTGIIAATVQLKAVHWRRQIGKTNPRNHSAGKHNKNLEFMRHVANLCPQHGGNSSHPRGIPHLPSPALTPNNF